MNPNKKYENYIFLTICEVSLELLQESLFSTYHNYCDNMNISLKTGTLTKKQNSELMFIANSLNKIYGLNAKETGEYIADYFDSGRYMELQKLVMLTKEIFPIVGN